MRGLDEVGELVDDHGVEDPGRHVLETRRDPDRPGGGRAGCPAALLVADPPDRAGSDAPEMAVRQLSGSGGQLVIGCDRAPGALQEAVDEAIDDPLAVAYREAGGHH